ncbi:MAG TPA: Npt1/Npt2 family nucleotide transporter [Bryobacteraceae bacterium]|nr:Npt1/Npt2 family nucleotide transporter [Bryobacteraceae bacterium]
MRTWSMFVYLLCILFAYYILKPVSRAMFLTKFDIDRLPSLYILMAIFGGAFAYLYSKLAAKTSLRAAVLGTMSLSVAALVAMWVFIRLPWMVYVLNIFVSLFSIVLVAQGWLVASNLFDAREAKRLYPLLGMAMVLGAAFGGEFTSRAALLIGTRNLMLASAVMVVLAYAAFRAAILGAGDAIGHARAAQNEDTDFSFSTIARDLSRTRHLQVIVGIMVAMYLVDTLVEYQFQVMARAGHTGDQLTAFFGQFYGLYLNLTEFVFQLFLTAAIVRRFGVGGTLQISPVSILLASIATILTPGITAASAVRLTEASTRYTLNRTGMELLYMPLPQELRNRVKAFIDICVDRVSRGLGGVLLLLLTTSVFHLGVRGIAVVVMALCVPWIYFSHLARREYVSTIRKRFAARQLDFESARISVHDGATIKLLESTVESGAPRQAAYAIGLLAEVPDYDIRPLLRTAVASSHGELRDKAYEIAAAIRYPDLKWGKPARSAAEAAYAVTVSPDRARLAAGFLESGEPAIAIAALDVLRDDPDAARQALGGGWLEREAASPDPKRRTIAAAAFAACPEEPRELLCRLIEDSDPATAAAACRSAATLKDRGCLFPLIHALGSPRVRADAIAALAAFGPAICGTLSDILLDESVPPRVRRQVPRVLKNIPDQRAVDVLLAAAGHPDLTVRVAVLKALNHLRETASGLYFDHQFITDQILAEARHYYELNAALHPFQEYPGSRHTAARLLALTIQDRLDRTLERLFRLLGLRYPPKEIYSAYLAVARQRHEEATAALEFLDNTLDHGLKRILLPLLDAPEHVLEHGKELYGVEIRGAEEVIRELIHSHDPWLMACAMAAAAELQLRSLAPEIHQAGELSQDEICEVARSAEAALAA